MLRATFRTIYLYLLVFGHLAECYVLLTANVDDIKQIAKKFLSETLSDQISEFFTKAKTQDTISEENERNAQDQEDRNSRELELHDEFNEVQQEDKPYGHDTKTRIEFAKQQNTNIHPNILPDRQKHQVKRHKKVRHNNNNPLIMNSGYTDVANDGNNANNYHEPNNFKRLKKIIRMNPVDGSVIENNYGDYKNRVRLTTEKQKRNEFDQYDFKSEFLSTNRQVAFPRVRAFNVAS